MGTKICRKCETELNLCEFYFRNKKENIRHDICKMCAKKNSIDKKYYNNNKEEYLAKTKIRQEALLNENRIKLLEYQQLNPCVDCGNDNPIVLEFDHLIQEEKTINISLMLRDYKWDKIKKEIDKCEVVCANCHRIRTAKQLNWWKFKINESQYGYGVRMV